MTHAEGDDRREVESAAGDVPADLTQSTFRIERPGDVLDLFGAGLNRVVLAHHQLNPDFFDLSTGFAGELVQKCVNYGIRVAVVGGDNEDRSVSFRQFAAETSRGSHFVFVRSVGDALARLS
jgi:hypothetical protein